MTGLIRPCSETEVKLIELKNKYRTEGIELKKKLEKSEASVKFWKEHYDALYQLRVKRNDP